MHNVFDQKRKVEMDEVDFQKLILRVFQVNHGENKIFTFPKDQL